MTTPYVSLNGTNLTPTGKEKKTNKIGVSVPNANGGRTWVQRTSGGTPIHKREWDLSFENVVEATRATIENLFLLATTFTFIDEQGVSYTVQCEADGYSDSFSFRSGSGVLYYNLSIKIYQI